MKQLLREIARLRQELAEKEERTVSQAASLWSDLNKFREGIGLKLVRLYKLKVEHLRDETRDKRKELRMAKKKKPKKPMKPMHPMGY